MGIVDNIHKFIDNKLNNYNFLFYKPKTTLWILRSLIFLTIPLFPLPIFMIMVAVRFEMLIHDNNDMYYFYENLYCKLPLFNNNKLNYSDFRNFIDYSYKKGMILSYSKCGWRCSNCSTEEFSYNFNIRSDQYFKDKKLYVALLYYINSDEFKLGHSNIQLKNFSCTYTKDPLTVNKWLEHNIL